MPKPENALARFSTLRAAHKAAADPDGLLRKWAAAEGEDPASWMVPATSVKVVGSTVRFKVARLGDHSLEEIQAEFPQ